MNKLTFEGLAAEVARTDFALPEADWNEQPATPAEAEVRTGKPTWGVRHVVEYRPRWKTDHHPWLVAGMDPKIGIRYADYEVAEGV
jgi:hypothetical protein